MANEIEILVLKDAEGNTFALNAEMVRSAKVPADKLETLKAGIADQDVAGFIFGSFNNVLTNFQPQVNAANLNQNQNQNAQNVAGGFFTLVGAQTAQNVGVQSGGIAQQNV